MVTAFTETEKEMVSVERINEYTGLHSEFEVVVDDSSASDAAHLELETPDRQTEYTEVPLSAATPLLKPVAVKPVSKNTPMIPTRSTSKLAQALSKPVVPAVLVGDDWPNLGGVVFKSVALKYPSRQMLSLRGLSLVILPGSRVGIVGRTGAGKSSLFQVHGKSLDIKCY